MNSSISHFKTTKIWIRQTLLKIDKLIHTISFFYLTLIILSFSFITNCTLNYTIQPSLSYDEFIVWKISRQEAPLLFNTLVSEPHPPGFYLLLKLFPNDLSGAETKVALSCLSYSLMVIAVLYGYKKKVISYFKLEYGLLLFLSSFSVSQLFNTVKQEAISIPLLCLILSIILKKIKDRQNSLGLATLLLLLIIFQLGYISFVWAIFFVGLFYLRQLVKNTLTKESLGFFIVLMGYVIVYFLLFGKNQFFTNQHRFSWFSESYTSFYSALSRHLVNLESAYWLTDGAITLFIILLFSSISAVKKKYIPTQWFFLSLIFVTIFCLVGYSTHLFVRTRYLTVLFLWLSVIGGWGLINIERNFRKTVSLIIILVFFITAQLVQILSQRDTKLFETAVFDSIYEQLNRFPERKFGLLTYHPVLQYIFKLQHFSQTPQLVATSAVSPDIFNSNQILQKHLILDGDTKNLDNLQTISDTLKSSGLHNYLFIQRTNYVHSYYDQEKNILKTLSQNCSTQITYPVHYVFLFIFTNCWETQPIQ